METIGERFKRLRKELNLTQVQLGDVLGVSGAAISKIEANDSNPTEAALKLICSTYHVYYRWLVYGEGQMFEDDPQSRIARIIEKVAPNASDFFKSQVIAYGTQMSDESWEIFKTIVEQVRAQKKE